MWDTTTNKLQSTLSDVAHQITGWSGTHLLNIVIIVIGAEVLYQVSVRATSKVVHKTARRPDLFPTALDRKKRVKTLDSLIHATLRIIILVLALIMIASELGINTAPLVASAGVIGVALGIGAQSFIRDLMSGFFIITENQYRVGDTVSIGTTIATIQIIGEVEAINIRTTVLRDLDGGLHHISNGTIVVASNLTMNFAQINEDIVVAMDTDIDKLKHVIDHVGEELAASPEFERAILTAPHFERIQQFTDEGISIKVIGKTNAGDQWRVKGELYKRLKVAFDKNHIKLAGSH